ncbi:MAG TPA: hypothetical protein VFH55_00700 [Nitrospiria bacterium]|nr:hypothetical protein [Nitrospiria bacterium]
MQRILIALLASLIFLLSIPLTAKQALAIPAFARKYNLPCSVCHVPAFPKLNDFGNQFRDHGYQLGGETDLPTNDTLTNGYWPVAFRTTVGYQASSLSKVDNGSGGTTSLNTGGFGFTGLDILSFGTLARDISFGVVFTPGLGSAGFGSGSSLDDSDLESAFLKVDNIVGSDYLVNLKVGKYELDVPFSEKRSPTLDTPFVMYHYVPGTPYRTILEEPAPTGYANPDDFGIGDNQSGLEIAGSKATPGDGFFRYSLNAISNSNVNADATGGGHRLNFYGHVTQSIGGYGIVSGQRVGLFGAYGVAPTSATSACPAGGCGAVARDGAAFYRAGLDVSVTALNQFNIFGAYMHAKDSQKMFSSQGIANAQDADWSGGFLEVDYTPTQLAKWLFSYRYDMVQNSQQGDPAFSNSFNDVSSHTLLARYNFNISARVDTTLHLEYNYYTTKKTTPTGGDQTGQTTLLAFDFAF